MFTWTKIGTGTCLYSSLLQASLLGPAAVAIIGATEVCGEDALEAYLLISLPSLMAALACVSSVTRKTYQHVFI